MTLSTEKMHRWSVDHPLPVHVSEGELTVFRLYSPIQPPSVKQSKAVSVSIEPSSDEWILEFSLNSSRYAPMFKSFYEDVFESTWKTDKGHAAATFVEIYNKWKRAFSTEGSPLSREEVQGLIGEMLAIENVFSKKYSAKEILDAWMVLEKGKQDFIFNDTWYEVKTTHAGSNSVIITSVEQLDDIYDGFLTVIKLKTTSSNDEHRVNLSILIERLQKYFDENNCGELFQSKLNELELPDNRYDIQNYNAYEPDLYAVVEGFPCIHRDDLPTAIGSVTCELYLEPIRPYRVK